MRSEPVMQTGSAVGDFAAPDDAVPDDAASDDAASDDAVRLRLARAYLLAVAEPPAPALSTFVAEHGPVAAADLVASDAVPRLVADETRSRRGRTIDAPYLERARTLGARLLFPEDRGEWPTALLACFDTGPKAASGTVPAGPIALWASGSARLGGVLQRSVTIVGSRQPSEYAEQLAGELAHTLAVDGVTIVSGAVSGIDAVVHRAALTAGGVTVAVVGYGLGVDPPASHIELLDQIRERGLVVSEYPLDTEATKRRYLARNRLLAGLSQATVLVEANLRSGAHQAAGRAAALGRPVMAVTAQAAMPTASAGHAMLDAGTATLATSAAEVLLAIDGRCTPQPHQLDQPPSRPTLAEQQPEPNPSLTGNALLLYHALDAGAGQSVEQLAAESGLPTLKVRAILAELELDGITERCETGWRRAPYRRCVV